MANDMARAARKKMLWRECRSLVDALKDPQTDINFWNSLLPNKDDVPLRKTEVVETGGTVTLKRRVCRYVDNNEVAWREFVDEYGVEWIKCEEAEEEEMEE